MLGLRLRGSGSEIKYLRIRNTMFSPMLFDIESCFTGPVCTVVTRVRYWNPDFSGLNRRLMFWKAPFLTTTWNKTLQITNNVFLWFSPSSRFHVMQIYSTWRPPTCFYRSILNCTDPSGSNWTESLILAVTLWYHLQHLDSTGKSFALLPWYKGRELR